MGQCIALFDGQFSKHILKITLPDFEQEPPEGFEATMSQFIISVRAKTKAGVPLLRTPRRCNHKRGWKSVVTAKFEDGSRGGFITNHPCHL